MSKRKRAFVGPGKPKGPSKLLRWVAKRRGLGLVLAGVLSTGCSEIEFDTQRPTSGSNSSGCTPLVLDPSNDLSSMDVEKISEEFCTVITQGNQRLVITLSGDKPIPKPFEYTHLP